MTPRLRIIGLGQAAAGDDGVGLVVLERLRAAGLSASIELVVAPEASALVPLLETPAPVVLVDAVLAVPPGEVLELEPEELEAGRYLPVSSHGLSVPQALGLARLLSPRAVSPLIRVLAVTIARPQRQTVGLTPEVARAVPRAVGRVLALVEELLGAPFPAARERALS